MQEKQTILGRSRSTLQGNGRILLRRYYFWTVVTPAARDGIERLGLFYGLAQICATKILCQGLLSVRHLYVLPLGQLIMCCAAAMHMTLYRSADHGQEVHMDLRIHSVTALERISAQVRKDFLHLNSKTEKNHYPPTSEWPFRPDTQQKEKSQRMLEHFSARKSMGCIIFKAIMI